MQVYKKLILLSLSSGLLFAQTTVSNSSSGTVDFPSVDSINSPDMPSVSAPVIGQPFYTPGSYYSNASDESDTNKASTEDIAESETKTTPSLSTLTASDLASLSSMGISLSSLLTGTSNTSTGTNEILSNIYTSKSESETNQLLKKVLNELENLKKQYAEEVSLKETENTGKSETAIKTSQELSSTQKYSPKILRFTINGYDLLSTCRTVYISRQAKDGSFLMTGDRRYSSDGNIRSETFHIIFKADGATQGKEAFSTATAVTQDYLNDYSFVYQMSQKDDLKAYKTGSFITMKTDDPTWKLDLLIDLGDQ